MSAMVFMHQSVYNTTILISDEENDVVFNENYKVYLEDNKIGKVYIEYNENLEIYLVHAEFTKAGKTNLILVDEKGNMIFGDLYMLIIWRDIIKKFPGSKSAKNLFSTCRR